jgi:hypothetical protein
MEPQDLFRESIGGVFKVLKQNRTHLLNLILNLNLNLISPIPSFPHSLTHYALILSPSHLIDHSSMQQSRPANHLGAEHRDKNKSGFGLTKKNGVTPHDLPDGSYLKALKRSWGRFNPGLKSRATIPVMPDGIFHLNYKDRYGFLINRSLT